MSTPRPTPETDAAEINLGSACGQFSEWYVKPSFARKLERERDEAREQLKAMRGAIREAHRFIRDIVKNHECGWDVDAHGESILTKLQPFLP